MKKFLAKVNYFLSTIPVIILIFKLITLIEPGAWEEIGINIQLTPLVIISSCISSTIFLSIGSILNSLDKLENSRKAIS